MNLMSYAILESAELLLHRLPTWYVSAEKYDLQITE